LYSKLVLQGKFDADVLHYKIAICDLNSLTADNPGKINHITNLIKLLQENGAGEKAHMIAEKLNERLNIFKQEELTKGKAQGSWWKKSFFGRPKK
jgi:hypothetical protein